MTIIAIFANHFRFLVPSFGFQVSVTFKLYTTNYQLNSGSTGFDSEINRMVSTSSYEINAR